MMRFLKEKSRPFYLASAFFHALLLLFAWLYHPASPPAPPEEIDLRVEFVEERPETSAPQQRRSGIPAHRLSSRTPDANTALREHGAEATRDSIISPATRDISPTVSEERLDRFTTEGLSREEAFGLLNRMLDRHPEYRRTIFRELLSGAGASPAQGDSFHLYLDRYIRNPAWLKTTELDRWRHQRSNTGPYDPVHGYDRDKKLGVQSPVLFLLLKLVELLKGQ